MNKFNTHLHYYSISTRIQCFEFKFAKNRIQLSIMTFRWQTNFNADYATACLLALDRWHLGRLQDWDRIDIIFQALQTGANVENKMWYAGVECGSPMKYVHPFLAPVFHICTRFWHLFSTFAPVCRAWNELSKSGLRFAVAALVSEL